MLFGGTLAVPATVTNVWTALSNCHQTTAFESQVKLNGSYTLPRFDVLVSAVYQNVQGPPVVANYIATNAVVAPGLGRNLAGGAANLTVNIIKRLVRGRRTGRPARPAAGQAAALQRHEDVVEHGHLQPVQCELGAGRDLNLTRRSGGRRQF